MMKNVYDQQLTELQKQVQNLLPFIDEDPIQNCKQVIHLLMKEYDNMRTSFKKQKMTKEEEIVFFKYTKPLLTSQLIYFNEVYEIENAKPVASRKTVRKYYNTQLKKREQFFLDNADFYKYYRTGNRYLDTIYFLRNQNENNVSVDSAYFQSDKKFTTTHDYKVAQILANEKLQHFLIDKLENKLKCKTEQLTYKLKWTGSKVGIVELMYALHSEGVFNNGAADIREIANSFGKVFDIEMGQFHRTFYEICNRKTERTKFLNALKENLTTRIKQSDE